jgi:hypothetical protein
MSGRGRLIAGQAAIVAVLIAVVWATLLRGGDSGTLSGIDAPGGPQALETDGGKGNGRGSGGRNAGDAGQASGVSGGAGGPAGGAAVATLDGTTGGATTSPTDEQYGDTVVLLKRRLGQAR